MKTEKELKELVQLKYGEIALQVKGDTGAACCGPSCCSTEVYNLMSDDYSKMEGYNAAADLGLGCGLPTEFARIKEGDTVIDLGSGAGNDCFVARSQTGASGQVIGIDFTEAMITRARANAAALGYDNVTFRHGDIEQMPEEDNVADVVVSNCVLNLVPDKRNVMKEIARVLKPDGHFSISDVVLSGALPEKLKKVAELYAGCVSGAVQREEYMKLILDAGFVNVLIQKEKQIVLPYEILRNYLTEEEINEFRSSGTGIVSITVFARKPTMLG